MLTRRFLPLALACAAVTPLRAATFTVTNSAGSGAGSLWQAILDANATPNAGGQPDRIHFAIPGTAPTISLGDLPAGAVSFPEVTEAVVIDGTTQPGYDFGSNAHTPAPQPKVMIDGAHVAGRVAFRLAASGCQVWGLGFDRIDFKTAPTAPPAEFGAITCENGSGGHLVRWCQFGGMSNFWTQPENRTSVLLKSPGNRVQQCLFFNHTDEAVRCEGANGTGNKIDGCWFGLGVFQGLLLDADNTTHPPVQVRLLSSGNTVGGPTAAERNVIATKKGAIQVQSPTASTTGNVIEGNWIGIAPPTVPPSLRGPVLTGITVFNEAAGTVIRGNTIGGCRGVAIALNPAVDTLVEGNILGTNAAGTADWGNESGIIVTGASERVTIRGNTIRNCEQSAVGVADDIFKGTVPQRVRVTQNSIAGNQGLGISLGDSGVLPNDPLDADDGPNRLTNFPVITAVSSDGIETTYGVRLEAAGKTRYEVEIFHNRERHASGHGEGETYVGTLVLTTDGTGAASGNLTVFGDPGPGWITATATETFRNPFDGSISWDGTSEFSAAFRYGPVEVPFAITAVRRGGGSVQLDFPVTTGLRYTVYESPNLTLGEWVPVDSFVAAASGPQTRSLTDPVTARQRFFRVVQASPL